MAKARSPMVRYVVLVKGVRVLALAERVRWGGMGRWRRSARYEGARLFRALWVVSRS